MKTLNLSSKGIVCLVSAIAMIFSLVWMGANASQPGIPTVHTAPLRTINTGTRLETNQTQQVIVLKARPRQTQPPTGRVRSSQKRSAVKAKSQIKTNRIARTASAPKASIFEREIKWRSHNTPTWHRANLAHKTMQMGFDPYNGKGNSTLKAAIVAYVLGTAQHETNGYDTMIEYGGPKYHARYAWVNGNQGVLDAQKFPGMGYVQCTGKGNYGKSNRLLLVKTGHNYKLLQQPKTLASQPRVAARLTALGMLQGTFTGKSLSDYINQTSVDPGGAKILFKYHRKQIWVDQSLWLAFYQARRTVNGMDQAAKIADYAMAIYLEIKAGQFTWNKLENMLQI